MTILNLLRWSWSSLPPRPIWKHTARSAIMTYNNRCNAASWADTDSVQQTNWGRIKFFLFFLFLKMRIQHQKAQTSPTSTQLTKTSSQGHDRGTAACSKPGYPPTQSGPKTYSRLLCLMISLIHDWIFARESYLIRHFKIDGHRARKSTRFKYHALTACIYIYKLYHVLRIRTVNASAMYWKPIWDLICILWPSA